MSNNPELLRDIEFNKYVVLLFPYRRNDKISLSEEDRKCIKY